MLGVRSVSQTVCPALITPGPSVVLPPALRTLTPTCLQIALEFTLSHGETGPPGCSLLFRIMFPSPPSQDHSPLRDHEWSPVGERTRNGVWDEEGCPEHRVLIPQVG